jgi:hypothetical protein
MRDRPVGRLAPNLEYGTTDYRLGLQGFFLCSATMAARTASSGRPYAAWMPLKAAIEKIALMIKPVPAAPRIDRIARPVKLGHCRRLRRLR